MHEAIVEFGDSRPGFVFGGYLVVKRTWGSRPAVDHRKSVAVASLWLTWHELRFEFRATDGTAVVFMRLI